MDYTLSVEPDEDGGMIACVRGRTAAGRRVELERWPATSIDSAIDELESRGWRPTGKRPTGSQPVTVTPDTLRPIVATVIEQRQAAQQAAADWSDALYDLIATMPPKGDPRYVPVIELAKTAGLSRDRIYGIRRSYLGDV